MTTSSASKLYLQNDQPAKNRVLLLGGSSIPAKPALKRFALIIDGLARASLLPQAPHLVHRVLAGKMIDLQILQWTSVVYYVSLLMSISVFARSLGALLGNRYQKATGRLGSSALIARLGGLDLLLFYTTTAGSISSFQWLLATCFFSAFLAGVLTGMTSSIVLPEDELITRGETAGSASYSKVSTADLSSGESKMYLQGFSLSILLQFLWLPDSSGDITRVASQQSPLSIVWFVGITILLEILLRTVFSFCSAADEHFALSAAHSTGLARLGSINKPRCSSHHESYSLQVKVPAESTESVFHLSNRNVSLPQIQQARRESLDFPSSVRSRIESNTSIDEFFDCHSILSDADDVPLFDEEMPLFAHASTHEMKVARYINNRCVFEDGSSAYVPPGESPCRIPSTYLDFYKGKKARAQTAWDETQRWRLEKRVWKIHTLPNPWFAKIKQAYPHFVHGYSKAGYPIIYEQPGKMELKRLFAEGCQVDDMLYCYTFFMEYVSNVICTREEIRAKLGPNPPPHCSSTWGIMVVMDVKGAGLSHLSGNVARYVKNAGDINSAHYPMSMKRAFLINAPFWLGGAWSGIKGLLPDSVQVDILSERMFPAALREYIDEDQIPPEYGGTSPYSLGQHPYEVELRQLVDHVARAENEFDLNSNGGPLVVISMSEIEKARLDGSNDHDLALPHVSTFTSLTSATSNTLPQRRRIHSIGQEQYNGVSDESWKGHRRNSNEFYQFLLVTFLCGSFLALQGALELAIPFWILSPTSYGGLGYLPRRSFVVIFCSTFFLLCLAQRKNFEFVLHLPEQNTLRAFRIGVGAELVLLASLAFVSFKIPALERNDSVLLTSSTIVILAGLAVANGIGRSAATKLHHHSALYLAQRTKFNSTWVQAQLESGRLSMHLIPIAQVIGLIFLAPVLCWSFSAKIVSPFYLSSVLLLFSWSFLLLYTSTFTHFFRFLSSHDTRSPSVNKRCCAFQRLPFLGEAVAVSAGDVASLMEEGHWNSTPILHHHNHNNSHRVRSFSDTSLFSDPIMMERGDADMASHKAN